MSARWFKSRASYGFNVGLALFITGLFFFLLFDGGKLEKIGVFLMTFGAMMVGLGYTAYIAYKQKLDQ